MSIKIQIVDKNDKPIGVASAEEARAKGLYHRIVRVILKDENGRILSQRRSLTKSLYPGLWTDSASGHVDEGETYEMAIKRELKEELGIEAKLTFLGKFLTNHVNDGVVTPVFNGVFEATISSSTKLTLDPIEVVDAKWYQVVELRSSMTDNPENFTSGFIEVVERYI